MAALERARSQRAEQEDSGTKVKRTNSWGRVGLRRQSSGASKPKEQYDGLPTDKREDGISATGVAALERARSLGVDEAAPPTRALKGDLKTSPSSTPPSSAPPSAPSTSPFVAIIPEASQAGSSDTQLEHASPQELSSEALEALSKRDDAVKERIEEQKQLSGGRLTRSSGQLPTYVSIDSRLTSGPSDVPKLEGGVSPKGLPKSSSCPPTPGSVPILPPPFQQEPKTDAQQLALPRRSVKDLSKKFSNQNAKPASGTVNYPAARSGISAGSLEVDRV